MSTSPGSGTRGGSGRGNEGLGRGKGSGGSFGSGLGIGGLCGAGGSGLGAGGLRGAGGSGRGSGSARGGASSQDDDVCETIHAPVGGVPVAADGDGDDGPVGGVSPVGGVDDGYACPGRTEAERRVGTSRVEREDERGSGVGEEGGVCAAGAAGRCVG